MPLPDDSPIHLPIFKVRQGDMNHLPRLVQALAVSPLLVMLEEPDDLTTCRFLVDKEIPYVIAFTNRHSVERWRDGTYPHEMDVTARQLCAVIKGDSAGIYLNPGDEGFGFPVHPKLLAALRELLQNTQD